MNANTKRLLYAAAVGILAVAVMCFWPHGDRRMGTNFPFVFGGDLSGTYASQTVVALQGEPMVASTASPPSRGAVLEYTDAGWAPLTTGAAGSVLIANGAGADPAWVAASDAGLGGWTTALDLNMSAQPTQSLSSDGTYTVAGNSTWRKILSANDGTAMALTNDAGLVQKPASSTDINGGTYTVPWFGVQLSSIISSYVAGTPLRVWGYIASQNIAAGFDNAVLGTSVYNASALTQNTQAVKYGQSPSGLGASLEFDIASTGVHFYDSSGFAGTDNVVMLEYPAGVTHYTVTAYTGVWSSGWPAVSAMKARSFLNATSGLMASSTANLKDASASYALWGAMRAGSGTTLNITWGQVRVDYRN